MSMPNIPNITPIIDIDREDTFNMLLASIALEEMGLAHIINAEGEKIQYLLDFQIHKQASIAEIKEVNQGVERVLRETMKLQMLLQEKLESVMKHIPKESHPPNVPCPQPPKLACKPECILTGYGEGQVSNKFDLFYCGIASIESSLCDMYENCITFSIKYTLCKETEHLLISAILLTVPESTEIRCLSRLKPCPIVQDPNVLVMQGQGVMAIKRCNQKLAQCTVTFALTVWDYGCNKKFQMIICSPNTEFNHDSGIVTVTSGNLEIKKFSKLNRNSDLP